MRLSGGRVSPVLGVIPIHKLKSACKTPTVILNSSLSLSGIGACVKDVAATGYSAFYKGFIPAFTRLGPQTILTFVFFEQFRMRFGRDVAE